MSGAGNDFIVIDNRFYRFTPDELGALALRLCARRVSVGADGLLALDEAAEEGGCDFRMRYYNADGSLGTMCGNGARCLARYAAGAGMGGPEGRMRFESDAGVYAVEAPPEDGASVTLHVPPPQRFRRGFQPAGASALDDLALPYGAHYLWTGTEHLVCFVEDAAAAPVARWGPALRRDPGLGAAGANVNFVQVLSEGGEGIPARLRVRTYEKGVEAETLACGTGAMASAITARLVGAVRASAAAVHMPGGVLEVAFRPLAEGAEDVTLSGPAEVVYRGSLEL